MLHSPAYVGEMFPNLVEHAFIPEREIQTMNQQPRYLRKTRLEYKENHPLSNSKESVLPTKEFQDLPDVLELTRIMFGAILSENARNMTLRERHAFYNVASDLISLTHVMN